MVAFPFNGTARIYVLEYPSAGRRKDRGDNDDGVQICVAAAANSFAMKATLTAR